MENNSNTSLKDKPRKVLAKSKNSIRKNLSNATHLYLHHKYIRKISPSIDLTGVCVLYLHNNEIEKIENLNSCTLTSLFLQSNAIEKIENLELVENLKKLYLNNNAISVVEGLSNHAHLEELHLSKQYLPSGATFCFDPRTITALSETLQILHISDNKVDSIKCLVPLRNLKILDASNNKLDDIDEVCETIKKWYYLKEAWFKGNPISKRHKYREDIIGSTYTLDCLDDKAITAASRNFIKGLENEKHKQINRPISLADYHPNLPKNYAPPIQKAVSASLIQSKLNVRVSIDDNIIALPPKVPPKRLYAPIRPILKTQTSQNMTKKVEFTEFPIPITSTLIQR